MTRQKVYGWLDAGLAALFALLFLALCFVAVGIAFGGGFAIGLWLYRLCDLLMGLLA